MKLILHCGIHRTATTYLQSVLHANRTLIENNGVLYPFDEVNHQAIANRIKNESNPIPAISEQIKAQAGGRVDRVLLSAEDFSSIDVAGWVEEFARHFEVLIVVYLRRQDLWLNSWYNQHIKWPWMRENATLSPERFLATLEQYFWLRFDTLLEGWSKQIPANNIRIGLFEGVTQKNVLADFLAKVGLEHVGEKLVVDLPKNESVSARELEILRHLSLIDLGEPARQRVLDATQAVVRRIHGVETSMAFSPPERRKILALFEAGNRNVAELYFPHKSGALFNSQIDDLEPHYRPGMASVQSLPLAAYLGHIVRQLVDPKPEAQEVADRPAEAQDELFRKADQPPALPNPIASRCTFAFAARPFHPTEWQAVVLAASLRQAFPASAIECFFQAGDIGQLPLRLHDRFRHLGVKIRPLPDQGGACKTVPAELQKVLLAAAYFPTERVVVLGPDMFVRRSFDLGLICQAVAAACAEVVPSWGDETAWETLYETFRLERKATVLTLPDGSFCLPAYNSGLVPFAADSEFAEAWLSAAVAIDRDDGIRDKAGLVDQIALPIAIEKAAISRGENAPIALDPCFNTEPETQPCGSAALIWRYGGRERIYRTKINQELSQVLRATGTAENLFDLIDSVRLPSR